MLARGLWCGLAGGLALLAAGCGGRDAGAKAAAEPAMAVRVMSVATAPVEVGYEAVGTVRSDVSSTLSSKIVGEVVAVYVREGARVQKGDPLIDIDARDAQAEVQKGQAGLEEARNAVLEADNAIRAAESARDAAQANLELAQATHERYRRLIGEKAISQQAYDEASAKYRAATAELQRAGDMLSSARTRRDQAESKVAQATADLDNAQVGLSYARLTAPMAGLVTRKHVDVGDQAAPGVPLLELEDPRKYRLEATVDESQLANIHTGMQATVVIDALGNAELPATVADIVPAADTMSRSFLVKLDLPEDDRLRSGMFGKARFAAGEKPVITVPEPALVERGQLTYVYVVGEDNRARMRLVTTGRTYGDRVEVLSGLNDGDRVVVAEAEGLQDGATVRAEP